MRKIIRLKQSNKEKYAKRDDSDEENEDPTKSSSGNDSEFENIDVVLTTYQSACSAEQDRVAIKKLGVGYAIFDEGHMLKNMNTNRYQQLMKIGARRRILLTGTPLQNNLLGLENIKYPELAASGQGLCQYHTVRARWLSGAHEIPKSWNLP